MVKINEKHVDAMLKIALNEARVDKVNITSMRFPRNGLIFKKCHKDTGALETEQIVITCQ